MSVKPITLSTAPPEHPALDYAGLVAAGVKELERLAGSAWTDFNAHDPGITILEAACYALTDLGYRIFHPIPDLLADRGDPRSGLFTPREALTGKAATADDLRRVVLDVVGVKNAWIEPADDPTLPLRHAADRDAGKMALWLDAGDPASIDSVAVELAGLQRVVVERSDLQDFGSAALLADVVKSLHAHRGLCEDFEDVRVLDSVRIALNCDIEIDQAENAEDVLLGVYESVGAIISPSVAFVNPSEALAAGATMDAVFDGPALTRGVLDSGALSSAARRKALHVSDLLREIMAVPGVRIVRSIGLARVGGVVEPWSLPLEPFETARLDLKESGVQLYRAGHQVVVDKDRVADAYNRARAAQSFPALPETERDVLPPPGGDRFVGDYTPLEHDLPPVYGVGTNRLPDTASDARRAQANQLRAYLALFDQLLANEFAQLALARSLFSVRGADGRTYASQLVGEVAPEEANSIPPILAPGFDADALQALVEKSGSADAVRRTRRFLDHLLARFAETVSADPSVGADASEDVQKALTSGVLAKRQFLRNFPELSGGRGAGLDYWADPAGAPALAERVRLKLGLSEDQKPLVVEHILLRPIKPDEVDDLPDDADALPFLSDASAADPFSLQLTFVFPETLKPLERLAQTVAREETPAHLVAYIRWLKPADFDAFAKAHAAFLSALNQCWKEDGAGWSRMTDDIVAHLEFRDARDRVIDLVGLGETYPLRDIPVPKVKAPFGSEAYISLAYGQLDVDYSLIDEKGNEVGRATGAGAPLTITTPKIAEEKTSLTFKIQARKRTGRTAVLFAQARVTIGLDLSLEAAFLDPAPASRPTIIDYGGTVAVRLKRTQHGVDYRLAHFPGGEPATRIDLATVPQEQILSKDDQPVRGGGDSIDLPSKPIFEDTMVRILASNANDRQGETELLQVVLPLLVRADPARSIADPARVVAYRATTEVRLAEPQASAAYRAYVHPIADAEYRQGFAPGAGVASVKVDGALDALVGIPELPPQGGDLPGFTPAGDWASGRAADLVVPLPPVADDLVVAVMARKEHRTPDGPAVSAVWLHETVVALARPDPNAKPLIRVWLVDGKTDGTLEFNGGQPGVFYTLAVALDGKPIERPAYVHKRDAADPTQNKGLGQLKLEVDYVIARDASARDGDLAHTPPPQPLLTTPELPAGAELILHAVKAQTRAGVDLAARAAIDPLPELEAPALVAFGATASVQVKASRASDRYALWRDGKPVGDAKVGDGKDLTFVSNALTEDAVFEIAASGKAEGALPVERRVRLRIKVRPNPGLAVRPRHASVTNGASTVVLVEASQPSVSYRLRAGADPVGAAVPGDGGEIELPTGPITATATFSVTAARMDDAAVSVTLAQTATVTVTAAPG